MVSSPLYSSYSRYKADTNMVSEWLFDTATRCGFPRPEYTHQSTHAGSTKTSRLKGKARKLSKAPDTLSGELSRPATRTYRIKAHEFVRMARFISKLNNPRVQVPRSFVKALNRAISTRKSHQLFYDRYHNEEQTLSGECGHTHFIKTLESVLEILSPCFSKEREPDSPKDSNQTTTHPLANVFASLTMEESDESVDQITPTQTSDAIPKVKVNVEEGEDRRIEETFLASTLLCRDVHRLRMTVQKIWKSYREGDIDLVAASITTNTAIDFCRKLQQEFDETFPVGEKFHEVGCLYCVFLIENGLSNIVQDDRGGHCLKHARRIVSEFIDSIKDDSTDVIAAVHPAHTELYASTNGRTDESFQANDQFYIDYKLAMGILPEFYALILRSPKGLQAEHEVIRATRHIVSQKKQTFWTTFSIEVLLDIRHVLREDIGRGLQDLRRGGRTIKTSIKKVGDFHRDMDLADLTDTDRTLQEVVSLVARWTEHDHVHDILDRENRAVEPNFAAHVPRFYLLERDPLWCGLLLYNFRMEAHKGAILTANSWTFVLVTSHLYNSLRQAKLLRCEWADMERLISIHGVENLFVGSLPTTFMECFKRCTLACGVSAGYLARNIRSKNIRRSPAKQRKLEMLAPVSWSFKKRFCDGDGRTDLGPNDVMDTLRKSHSLEAKRQFKSLSRASVDEVLCLLGFHIHMETLEINFNHFEMHVTCWKLLRGLHHNLDPGVSEWSKNVYMDDRNLPTLVLYLLSKAAEHEKATNALSILEIPAIDFSMSKTAELFEEFLELSN